MSGASPIICAIDTTDVDAAIALAKALAPHVGAVKLGLEFFAANGAAGVKQVAALNIPIFLDLKFHDIPNTVSGAIRATLEQLGDSIFMLTVHTSGGMDMCRAARDAAGDTAEKLGIRAPQVIGVTLLTSLDANAVASIGFRQDIEKQVIQLAELGIKSGLDGLVCSPLEVASLRSKLGASPTLVVPGIRPAGADAGDQKRTMTPQEALQAGASYLVIGRPITQAKDPASAAQAINESL